MTLDLKQIASRILDAKSNSASASAVSFESMTVHLRSEGQAETVILHGKGKDVGFSCTCGKESCAHVRWVMHHLLNAGQVLEAPETDLSRRSELPGQRLSSISGSLRVVDSPDGPLLRDKALLAERLEELVTAVVRVGTEAVQSPSVEDALKRLLEAAPQPLPLGFERWLGRIKTALNRTDLHRLARVLYGGCLSADALRNPREATPPQLAAWFGAQRKSYADAWQANRIQDNVFMEIAREWLPGSHRAAIERRYLVSIDTGEVFCEDRQMGEARVSSGPCPRLVHVGLAHLEPGTPRRIRLLQYAISGRISAADWAKVKLAAVRRFRPLAQTYREAVKTFPALAEPFVLVRPARFEYDGAPVPLDEEDTPLPLAAAENPAELDWISRVINRGDVQWMAGRLVDTENCLMLRVRSVGVLENNVLRHHRIS